MYPKVPMNYDSFDGMADPRTARCLLPTRLMDRDNSRRMKHYKIALQKGFEHCLTPIQRENLYLYYWKGLKKTEIARQKQQSASAVGKSIHAGEEALREYIEQYMEIFVAVEREILSERDL